MGKKLLVTIIFTPMLFVFAACGGKKHMTEIKESGSATDSVMTVKSEEMLLNKNGERIVFKASGTEPFWGFEISEKAMRFTSMIPGFENYNVPTADPIRAADANVKMYVSKTESGTIRVQVTQAECINDMSGKISGYEVKVEIKHGTDKNFTELKGCGSYISDYRLNDIWVLEEMEDKSVSMEDFQKEVPNMEIHTNENTFMGFAGCNRMNGKIFSEENLLRFTDIATTRMMCQPENKESVFLKNLRSSAHYYIENNRLYLSNPEGPILIFKKVD